MIKVVLDTNVLVSGILKSNSTSAFCLDLVLNQKIIGVYSQDIINEYLQVLNRPDFGFSKLRIINLIKKLVEKGETLNLKLKNQALIDLVDPSDYKFLQTAHIAKASFLITGNIRHFPKKYRSCEIITPREFINWIGRNYQEL